LRIVTVEEVTQKEAGPAGDHHHALIWLQTAYIKQKNPQ
jgi:hypothetical protein